MRLRIGSGVVEPRDCRRPAPSRSSGPLRGPARRIGRQLLARPPWADCGPQYNVPGKSKTRFTASRTVWPASSRPRSEQHIIEPALPEQRLRVRGPPWRPLVVAGNDRLELDGEAGGDLRGAAGAAAFQHDAVAVGEVPLGLFLIAQLGGEKSDLAGLAAAVGDLEDGPRQRAFQARLVRRSPAAARRRPAGGHRCPRRSSR